MNRTRIPQNRVPYRSRRRGGLPKSVVAFAQLTAVFGVLLSVNAYVFFWRKRTSLPELHRHNDDRNHPVPSASIGGTDLAPQKPKGPPPLPSTTGVVRWVSLPADGQSLDIRFADTGVPPAALPVVLLTNPEHAHADAFVGLGSDGAMVALDLIGKGGASAYWRKDGKAWAELASENRKQKIRTVALSGPVASSLAEAISRLPVNAPDARSRVAALLGSEVDFDDKNDRIGGKHRVRVLIDRHEINGAHYRDAAVRAIEWQNDRHGLWRAVEYPPDSGLFYTERGDSAQRRTMRSPFEIVLAPASNRRIDRVSNNEWRAPVGTPVAAMTDGKVLFVQKSAKQATITVGQGDLQVQLRGAIRVLSTVRVGSRVERGQRLGEVLGEKEPGATNNVTVEITQAGKHVDAAPQGPRAEGCPQTERPAFGEHLAHVMKALAGSEERVAKR